MRTTATWAFWRRTQYAAGALVFLLLIGTGLYYAFFYTAATCFDTVQNGDEQGIDCGGACTRICSFSVMQPKVLWSRAFRVKDGQYNAVAYIENQNLTAGIQTVHYTFSLYDADGLITERSGDTPLPPNSTYPIFEGNINTGTRVPTQTFIKLDNIDTAVWQPATKGREQFVVNGRELHDTDTKPRLDATIENAAITEAKNVEIVATIFDKNGTALTASRTVVPRFPGKSTQNIVFTWPEPIAKTVRSCEVPTDVVLAIDLSGSMDDDGGNPPQPVTSVLDAAHAFVSRLKQNDQASVVTFASTASLKDQLSSNTNVVGSDISNLSIAQKEQTGSTDTGDAIKLAETELLSERHNANARKVVVLLTDGKANAPGKDPEQYALDAAQSLRNDGAEIYVVGLGENVNEDFLRKLASNQQHYYFAPSAATVDKIYRTITSAICEDGPAVIDIIPKTETSFTPLR